MKNWFYFGVICLVLLEIANVYFIMPMPGSQKMDSLDLAYTLYKYRWIWRSIFYIIILIGLLHGQWKQLWIPAIPLLILTAITYFVNFELAADAMFKQPNAIVLSDANKNQVDGKRLILGVVDGGIAKAYPIQFIGYHHFVYDTINGRAILVTYCTVCRTGRVFDPVVDGQVEKFRLVGMDHFNAMMEDATTKSWWQQATGEAVAGKRKGSKLKEIFCTQTSLNQWLELYPHSFIMQADKESVKHYDTSYRYESGKSKSKLTGTDSLSGKNKSWVVGMRHNSKTISIDWNELKKTKIINSTIGNTTVFVVLAQDEKSFFAFENPSSSIPQLKNDTIEIDGKYYKLNGAGINLNENLKPILAYQEFNHSWKEFSNK